MQNNKPWSSLESGFTFFSFSIYCTKKSFYSCVCWIFCFLILKYMCKCMYAFLRIVNWSYKLYLLDYDYNYRGGAIRCILCFVLLSLLAQQKFGPKSSLNMDQNMTRTNMFIWTLPNSLKSSLSLSLSISLFFRHPLLQ